MMNMQLLQILKSGNPQQIAMQMLQQNAGDNPVLNNVLQMAQGGNMSGVEQIARNLCKSRGVNPDEMMKQLQQQFK